MDEQIIKRFKMFQKETGKHIGFDIENVEYKIVLIEEIITSFIKGATPKYDEEDTSVIVIKSGQSKGGYNNFDFSKKAYLDINKIANPKYLEKGDILINTTGVGTAGRVTLFDLDGDYVSDSHITALRYNLKELNKYYLLNFFIDFGFKNLESLAVGSGGQIELNMNIVKSIKIRIPKSLNATYTSIKIQEIFVEFIDYYANKNDTNLQIVNNVSNVLVQIEKVVLPLFFQNHESVSKKFDRFCEKNNINLKLSDIEFETKRIISSNSSETICNKRMGFTPKCEADGDIHWFTVGDLSKNNSMIIDVPITKSMTTIDLITTKVGSRSEKLPPIRKGDVLVSFKLTVGVVKIYNSELPAYCNEAIDILTPNENINSYYLAYNCKVEYPKYGERTNNGITLNDDHKKLIEINIPKDNDKFSSLEIQKIIVDFTENYLLKINTMKSATDKLKTIIAAHSQTIIYKTFNA
jgi:type I restriction enzyme S subunit